MKHLFLLLLGLCLSTSVLAQEQALEITNLTKNKSIIIKNDKRVKVQTSDGFKYSGRLTIVNDSTIRISAASIALDDIQSIKRNSLFASVLTSSAFVYLGAITAGFSVLIGVLVDSAALWLTLPAAGLIYAGIKSPNFHKKFKSDTWSIDVISISD